MDGLYPTFGGMSCTIITSVSLRWGSTRHDGNLCMLLVNSCHRCKDAVGKILTSV